MKNLLAIVDRAALAEGNGPVRLVHLRIGEMAGVSEDALRFAFDVLAKGTAAEAASLDVEKVPLRVHCTGCGGDSNPSDFVFICPVCGSTEIEIRSGREMEVDYILVGDRAGESEDSGA
ncbi:MAG: hydrogenase maturation nickel metallochaperone HypA [Candidatus Krumholzibacteria bacterium]|nr:hydrogenase maturation nickel metallochaperone HypA [Candidatus Krumholzibacteria bacterium]